MELLVLKSPEELVCRSSRTGINARKCKIGQFMKGYEKGRDLLQFLCLLIKC